ncbi:MAG: pyruvate, water dikinase regulatory protein [Planctomycetota bacterium]|jgi:regulator of PEP synthase PpsR (kinase-PPPase family)
MLSVFVVSDATGGTAERVLRAALAQFEGASVSVVRRKNVRSADQVRAVVEEATQRASIILHTLVSDGLRRLMLDESRVRGVDSLDMLGPLLERLVTHLGLSPREKPGLFKQRVEARSREIEAVEFAFHHDDGQHVDDLDRAEVVLVGASRTMKTPTMLYLAYRGWFAANVPLVPELDPPPELLAVPPARVVGLHMAVDRLVELRRVRAEREAIPIEPYASPPQVRKELQHTERERLKHGWRRVNVTGKSVEEAGREIIAMLPEDRRDPT